LMNMSEEKEPTKEEIEQVLGFSLPREWDRLPPETKAAIIKHGNPEAEEAVERLIETVSKIPGRFKEGVERTVKDVIALGIAGEDTYAAAMRLVLDAELRKKGLEEYGTTADWKKDTIAKAEKWEPGVRLAKEKILKKFRVIIPETLAAAEEARKLPRGAKGSPENRERMLKYFEERVRLARERKGIPV